MTDEITSAANPLVKRIRLLGDRRHRRRVGAFVVQGGQPVWQAVEAGADIETLIVAPDLLSGPAARRVADAQQQGIPVARLSAALFRRLADRDGPAGIAAIVRGRPGPLSGLAVPPRGMFAVLHQVGNPGNLGTIIRTASAAGAAGVIVVGQATDPYDPAAVKASMGALFSVPVAHAATAGEFFDWAAGHGIGVSVTSARGRTALWDWQPAAPGAVLLGSEGAGLPDDVLARGEDHVRIPMTGTAESLNLAVAAGLLLYEAWRARSGGPR
ncbi:MAG: TrmH family RNA methyltransferase [Streptosporangiaceae bacterium]